MYYDRSADGKPENGVSSFVVEDTHPQKTSRCAQQPDPQVQCAFADSLFFLYGEPLIQPEGEKADEADDAFCGKQYEEYLIHISARTR